MEKNKSKIGYFFIAKNTKIIRTPTVTVDFEGMQDVWVDGFSEQDVYQQFPVEEYNQVDLTVIGWYEKIFNGYSLDGKIKENEHNLIVFLENKREFILNRLKHLRYFELTDLKPFKNHKENIKRKSSSEPLDDWFEKNKQTCTKEEWYRQKK